MKRCNLMRIRRKCTAVLAVLFLGTFILTGCTSGNSKGNNDSKDVVNNSNETSGSGSDVNVQETSNLNEPQQPATVPDYSGYVGYDDTDITFNVDKYLNERPGVDYGKVENIEYYSKVAGMNRKACIMLPAGYDGSQSYPVVYMCHGINCGPTSYSDIGGMTMLHNLIDDGLAVPMIIVGMDNNVLLKDEEQQTGYSKASQAYNRSLQELTECLMPYVMSHYNVKTGKENTAIGGFSLGGKVALHIAFSRQDLFGYVSAVAPASGVTPNNTGSGNSSSALLNSFTIDPKFGGFKMLILCAGEDDGICGPTTERYHRQLEEAGIQHMYYRCEGSHENKVWQSEFYNYLKRLFK